MKFYQQNKLIKNERANTADFIKEVTDSQGRLISYVYMGKLPIFKESKYYHDWLDFKENGTTTSPIYELVF